MRRYLGRKSMVGAVLTLAVVGFAIALVTAGGIVAWEFSNSNAFCTNMCHSVHPEEPVANAASYHARVNCVECHMGRLSTLQLMAIKPTHVNELWGMIAGYERPTGTHSMRPARDSCEACHWPAARHSDTVRVKVRYDSDPKSREERTTLLLHTGGGEAREGGSLGIHWHVNQEVLYVPVDAAKQKIALVESRGPDGKLVQYFDASAGMTLEQAKNAPRRRMDCIDCHNATGHPFPNPANLVDEAIQEEKISRSIPSVKKRSDEIIARAAGLTGPLEERGRKIDEIIAASAPKQATGDAAKREAAFAKEMKAILLRTTFAGEKLSWKTFPDNIGHKDFPGCFRCHDGKHQTAKGEAIRLQCTLCHALPQVVREDGARSVTSVVSPDLTPPPSHGEPNWMHEHRTQLDDTCKMCHGKIQWGADGGSFCSNPACHGRKWPEMTLDAKVAAAPAPAPTNAPAAGKK